MSDFINEAAAIAAAEALADRTSFALSADQWAAFTAALDRPAEAKPALAALLLKKSILE